MRSALAATLVAVAAVPWSSREARAEAPTSHERSVIDLGVEATADRGSPRPEHLLVADLGLHVIGVGYQATISPAWSAQVALDAYVPWTENFHVLGDGDLASTDVAGVVVRQRLFFYPFGAAPAGLWISPFVQYGVVWATRDDELRSGATIAFGSTAGYALLISEAFHVSLGGGAQYAAARVSGGEGSPSFAGLRPTVDILLGYAF